MNSALKENFEELTVKYNEIVSTVEDGEKIRIGHGLAIVNLATEIQGKMNTSDASEQFDELKGKIFGYLVNIRSKGIKEHNELRKEVRASAAGVSRGSLKRDVEVCD